MDKIYIYAASNTSAERIKTELVYALSNTNNLSVKRFIETMFGLALKKSDVPTKTCHWNGSVRTLTNFDYIEDRVNFQYESTEVRYFKDVNDAERYAKTGEYVYSTSSSKETYNFSVMASHTFTNTNYCTVDEWLSAKVVTEE